jgi:predicted AAA+ superfamily ATPase
MAENRNRKKRSALASAFHILSPFWKRFSSSSTVFSLNPSVSTHTTVFASFRGTENLFSSRSVFAFHFAVAEKFACDRKFIFLDKKIHTAEPSSSSDDAHTFTKKIQLFHYFHTQARRGEAKQTRQKAGQNEFSARRRWK